MKKEIWRAVVCQDDEVDGTFFVYCHAPTSDSSGALYAVPDNDTLSVSPINGFAKQYLGDVTAIETVDGRRVSVEDWPLNNPVNIIDVIDEVTSWW